MTPGERFVQAARGFCGVPFRHHGRTRGGLDCVGLVLLAAGAAGIAIDDPGRYARFSRGHDLSEWLRARFDRADAMRDGDILMFSSQATHLPCHVGLRATRHALPSVIHAHAARGFVQEERLGWDLVRELRGAWRVRGA